MCQCQADCRSRKTCHHAFHGSSSLEKRENRLPLANDDWSENWTRWQQVRSCKRTRRCRSVFGTRIAPFTLPAGIGVFTFHAGPWLVCRLQPADTLPPASAGGGLPHWCTWQPASAGFPPIHRQSEVYREARLKPALDGCLSIRAHRLKPVADQKPAEAGKESESVGGPQFIPECSQLAFSATAWFPLTSEMRIHQLIHCGGRAAGSGRENHSGSLGSLVLLGDPDAARPFEWYRLHLPTGR